MVIIIHTGPGERREERGEMREKETERQRERQMERWRDRDRDILICAKGRKDCFVSAM